MKMYMCCERHEGPTEGACLVFANTAREAHKLAWPIIHDWTSCDWVDVEVRRLRDCEHLRVEAKHDGPHVVECPRVCGNCEQWGEELDEGGLCEYCRDEMEGAE